MVNDPDSRSAQQESHKNEGGDATGPQGGAKGTRGENAAEKCRQYAYAAWNRLKNTFKAGARWILALRLVVMLRTRDANFWFTLVVAVATTSMAITTIFYTLYARKQWKVIADQLYVMGDTSVIERHVQSAYVDVPQKIRIRTTAKNGRVISWIPEITVVNDGNTGSYITTVLISIYASNREMLNDFSYPDTGNRQSGDLGPHEEESFDAPPIEIADIQSIQRGGHVYIYGWVKYWDVFQFYGNKKAEDRMHFREFCYELLLDPATEDVASSKYKPLTRLLLHGPDNCTDGDCSDYLKKVPLGTSK